MQSLGASRLMFPVAQGRGLRTQPATSPDLFQEVFQSRLNARLVSREQGRVRGQSRSLQASGAGKKVLAENGRMAGSSLRKTEGGPSNPFKFRVPAGQLKSVGQPPEASKGKNGSLAKGEDLSPPPALKNLLEFVAQQPDQTLRVSPEQALQVGAKLLEAGLPREEVENLVFAMGSQDLGLSLTALEEAWNRFKQMGSASFTGQNQSGTAGLLPPEIQEWLQAPTYRQLWERLTVPREMMPFLRLALSHLGARPQDLAILEGDSQEAGVPLSEIWQILQKCQSEVPRVPLSPSGGSSVPESGEAPVLAEAQEVAAEDLAAWRQVLLKSGLPEEVVDGLLGEKSPGTLEELRAALLALTPKESPPVALDAPKPLYLPQNLRLRTLGWESQDHGGRQAGRRDLGDQEGGRAFTGASDFGGSWQAALENAGFPGNSYSSAASALTPGGGPLSGISSWQLNSPEIRASVWSQVQSGIIAHLGPGESQVSLNLNPPELGQIQLTLRLVGQEVAITGVAGHPEVAELVQQGLNQLVQTLSQQGFTLTNFVIHAKDAPGLSLMPAWAGSRDKGTENGGRHPGSARRQFGGVDRFV